MTAPIITKRVEQSLIRASRELANAISHFKKGHLQSTVEYLGAARDATLRAQTAVNHLRVLREADPAGHCADPALGGPNGP